MRRNLAMAMTLGLAALAGCSSTGPFGRERLAMPVGPSYVGGRGSQVFPASDTIVDDVKGAMADVGVRAIGQSRDPGGLVVLEGKTADDRKARVTIQDSGRRAVVSAKVGWLGDEPITRALLERVGSRHGTFEAATPVEAEPAAPPILSRQAVSDATMLRGQLDAGYNPSVVP